MRRTRTPRLFIAIIVLAVIGSIAWFMGSDDAAQEVAQEEHHDETLQTSITAESAAMMGIEVNPVGPAMIRETKTLSGRIVLNQNTSAQVKARFAGIVRGVFKQVGEPVKRGEKLATVESNDSLQTYIVPSPLDGIVLNRNISVGDETGETPIFVVANLDNLWAEFFVFANDMSQISQGQKVMVSTLDGKLTGESTVQAVLPTTDSQSQTVSARAVVDNTAGLWRSGMTVRVDVVLSEKEVPLAVPTTSIQTLEGEKVVFVKTGDDYAATPVMVGTSDAQFTEITGGLDAGMEVVTKNSFVVKADIGKASAEHED